MPQPLDVSDDEEADDEDLDSADDVSPAESWDDGDDDAEPMLFMEMLTGERDRRREYRGYWGWDEDEEELVEDVEAEESIESLDEEEEDDDEYDLEDEEEEQDDEIEEVSEEEDFECLEYEQLLEAKLHPAFVVPRAGEGELPDDCSGSWTHGSADDSDSGESLSGERDVGWMRRRHASLAAAVIGLANTLPAQRGAASSSSSGSEESDGSRRVPHCFQDDDADRSDCTSASESAEVAGAAFVRHGFDHFWQNGPYIKYSRWRRHRLPTPEQPEPDLLQLMSTPTMDSLDEVAVPAAVRDAVSRLGAGFEPNTDLEFLVEELLLTGAQVAVAELAKTCDGNGAMLVEAAEMEAEMENTLRPLLSYADM